MEYYFRRHLEKYDTLAENLKMERSRVADVVQAAQDDFECYGSFLEGLIHGCGGYRANYSVAYPSFKQGVFKDLHQTFDLVPMLHWNGLSSYFMPDVPETEAFMEDEKLRGVQPKNLKRFSPYIIVLTDHSADLRFYVSTDKLGPVEVKFDIRHNTILHSDPLIFEEYFYSVTKDKVTKNCKLDIYTPESEVGKCYFYTFNKDESFRVVKMLFDEDYVPLPLQPLIGR